MKTFDTGLTDYDLQSLPILVKEATLKFWYMRPNESGVLILYFIDDLTTQEETDITAAISGYIKPPVPDSLAIAKNNAKDVIDYAAGRARERYVTTTPGQSAVYTQKATSCKSYKDAGYPAIDENSTADQDNWPYIIAEKAAFANNDYQTGADYVIAKEIQWNKLAANIEKDRLSYKRLIDEATTVQDVENLLYNGRVKLDKY